MILRGHVKEGFTIFLLQFEVKKISLDRAEITVKI